MERLSTQDKWQPWKGVILQLCLIFILFLPMGLVQYFLGMWGVVITELVLLAMAIIIVLAKKTPLKEVFPIKKPTVRDIIGTIILWIGTFPLSLITVGIMTALMPEAASTTTDSLNELLTSEEMIMTFVTVAILPPICEEAIVRGTTLSFFRSLKHDWVIVLIIGVFFGILHLDPVRFGTTAILGASLAYLMVKRNNIVLPVLLHFINNGIITVITFLTYSSVDEAEATSLANEGLLIVAVYLILGCLSPLFLSGAIHLLNPGKKMHNIARYLVAAFLCGVMFITGLFMYVAAIMSSPEFVEIYESIEAEQMEELDE